ncbi:hypothetical protein KP803_14730 [Vibrio sp. ZSDE26]|uniref:Uncharacterized protein n=1 Tax=Vibrio amylolyticus TaxID=2847292 RepID=A0A9X2BM39_9VIBR|nr:hypothetical protein [Vibrio amylolyticus]MCK6264533.1 hypothetical protein [Vibrio amylolyticus]
MSLYEACGIAMTFFVFVAVYIFIHMKYIRHHEAHKRFLAVLWELMKNTIHGDHLRTMGYNHEKEQKKSGQDS